jgi:hypothetical protein
VTDYARYYSLERYLFSEVSQHFKASNQLSVFDFFCIVIWKANRSKSKVAKRLLAQGHADLSTAVQALTNALLQAPDNKERLRTLIEGWGFRLIEAESRRNPGFRHLLDGVWKSSRSDVWSRIEACRGATW